ncbi:CoA-binding protein [Alicyclobacillaceae bacterium I2511]|nr:CoA-binding protein [Alicyclobacillaceae bacterium I2511]
MFQNPTQEEMAKILRSAHTIAVVGLSPDPERSSHSVAAEMQRRGYRVIPVNPKVPEVLGEKSYPTLLDIPYPVDIVDVFRQSDALLDVVKQAVQISAPIIWAQEGVYNEEAAELAKRHDKTIIMDACLMVMHSVLVYNRP